MSLTYLRRAVRPLTTIVFDAYDRDENRALTDQYVRRVDNPPPPGSPPGVTKGPRIVELDADFIRVEVQRWTGDAVAAATISKRDWTMRADAYRADIRFDREDLGRPDTVFKLAKVAPAVGQAWAIHERALLMSIIRGEGGTCYDDLAFWQPTAIHEHPVPEDGTFKNVLAPNWSDPALPSLAEAHAFMTAASQLLFKNSIHREQLLNTDSYKSNLRVIANSQASAGVFIALSEYPNLGSETQPNTWKGRFSVDYDPVPERNADGTETYVSVFHLPPNGPPPVFLLVEDPPHQLSVFDTNLQGQHQISWGWEAMMGAKAFAPQVGVQARPT